MKVLLAAVLACIVVLLLATPALADTWYHPNSGDTWYCDYYEMSDGSYKYWCYTTFNGTWVRVVGWDTMPRNGWQLIE